MRSGALRNRLTLQKRVITTDAEGTSTEGWTTVDTIWADIAPLGVTERLAAAQLEAELTHQVTIRWRSDVATASSVGGVTAGHNMRLLLGAQVLDITGVVDADEKNRRGRQLTLSCFERQV